MPPKPCHEPRKRIGKTLKDGVTKACRVPCDKLKRINLKTRPDCAPSSAVRTVIQQAITKRKRTAPLPSRIKHYVPTDDEDHARNVALVRNMMKQTKIKKQMAEHAERKKGKAKTAAVAVPQREFAVSSDLPKTYKQSTKGKSRSEVKALARQMKTEWVILKKEYEQHKQFSDFLTNDLGFKYMEKLLARHNDIMKNLPSKV